VGDRRACHRVNVYWFGWGVNHINTDNGFVVSGCSTQECNIGAVEEYVGSGVAAILCDRAGVDGVGVNGYDIGGYEDSRYAITGHAYCRGTCAGYHVTFLWCDGMLGWLWLE
jgi:hypothetical protein